VAFKQGGSRSRCFNQSPRHECLDLAAQIRRSETRSFRVGQIAPAERENRRTESAHCWNKRMEGRRSLCVGGLGTRRSDRKHSRRLESIPAQVAGNFERISPRICRI